MSFRIQSLDWLNARIDELERELAEANVRWSVLCADWDKRDEDLSALLAAEKEAREKAEAKAASHERDWYSAKSEFGDAMANARERERKLERDLAETRVKLESAELQYKCIMGHVCSLPHVCEDLLGEMHAHAETRAKLEAAEARGKDGCTCGMSGCSFGCMQDQRDSARTALVETLGELEAAEEAIDALRTYRDEQLAAHAETKRLAEAIIASLPKCDRHPDRPATKAYARGGTRCDECGRDNAPDYQRAAPLRAWFAAHPKEPK